MTFGPVAVCTAVLCASLPLMAGAATVSEAEAGLFSSDWAHPTLMGEDVTGISGTTLGNVYDIFRLAVPANGGDLVLTFGAGNRMENSYSAGTVVRYSYAPFPWAWAGDTLGEAQITWSNQADKTLRLALDPSRGDALYLALYNTHGVMDYTIAGFGRLAQAQPSVPALPAPVPVPAAAVLLGTALGGLGAAAALRRAARGTTRGTAAAGAGPASS